MVTLSDLERRNSRYFVLITQGGIYRDAGSVNPTRAISAAAELLVSN